MVLEIELKVPHRTCFGGHRLLSAADVLGETAQEIINSLEIPPLGHLRQRTQLRNIIPNCQNEITRGEAHLVIMGSFSSQPYASL